MRNLLALLLLAPCALLAQVPDYVPTDGLVAWYPMNGNALDESGNGYDCQSIGATLTEDRFGAPYSAYAFDGQGSHLQGASLPFSDLSISLWFRAEAGVFETYSGGTPPTGAQLIGQGTTHNPCRYCDWAIGISDWIDGVDNLAWEKANSSSCQVQQTATNWEPELEEWTHLVAVSEGADVSFYINNDWVSTIPFDQPFQQGGSILSIGSRYVENCNGGGSCTGPDNAWSGSIDDVAVWNRALTPAEITSLYQGQAEPPMMGCTDSTACNYDPAATEEDGSCFYGQPGFDCAGFCLPVDNDECGFAEPIACSQIVEATTVCADTTESDYCDQYNIGQYYHGGLWYSIMGTGDTLRATMCFEDTDYDTYLSVYEGDCDDLICVAGNDDQDETNFFAEPCFENFLSSSADWASEEGVEYFLHVSGSNSVTPAVGGFEFVLVCDGIEVGTCLDSLACNYNPFGTFDDGSCDYTTCAGCGLFSACNYDNTAFINDLILCDFSCYGCTDTGACNFNPEATIESGLCEYISCTGCLDPLACNHDTTAVIDAGNCDYTSCVGCTDPDACNHNPTATQDDGNCIVDFSISTLNGTDDLQVCPEEEVILNLQSSAATGALGCVENPFIVFDESIYKQDTTFSIAARFTLNQSDLHQNIYRQVSDGQISLYYSPTDGLVFQTKASYGNCYTASGWVVLSTQIEEGIQYSMVATYHRGESIRLYVDGELKATSSVNDGLLADCDLFPAEIGQDSDNALTIDEIGFYNSILDESSISDFTGCVNQSNLFGNALTLLEFNSNEIETSGTSDVIIASATMDSIGSSCSCGHPAFNQALWSTGLTSPSLIWSATADDASISVIIPDYPSCTDTIAITSYDASGCADPLACNFDSSAFCSLNCTYAPFGLIDCNAGASLCGENTIWNSTLQECVGIIPPPDSILVMVPSCGPGTVWDPINEMCIVAIPADLNFDGCVTVGDLLELLAVHGTCPPYPEWPDFPGDTSTTGWSCGDPLPYQGYDYATVQIGEQCWFAENCRFLPSVSPPEIGSESDGEPHAYVYDYSGTDVSLAMQSPQYLLHGALYNFQAATIWDVCPTGWHVPTKDEFRELDIFLGLDPNSGVGWSGMDSGIGDALKTQTGWCCNDQGNNITGFSAVGSGGRWDDDAIGFHDLNNACRWWTQTPSGDLAWHHDVAAGYPGIYWKNDAPKARGHSIRCLKD